MITLFQILFVAAAYEQTNVIPRARKAAVHINALAIDRRPPARRRRIVPCDLRRARLPVPPLFTIMFLDTLIMFKEVVRYAAHRVWYSFASVVHDSPVLVYIRLVANNRHARCLNNR